MERMHSDPITTQTACSGKRSMPARRAAARAEDPGSRAAPPFALHLSQPTPPSGEATGPPAQPAVGRAVQTASLIQVASSRDGVHLAKLSVQSGTGREVGLSVTLDRGSLQVRIEAPDGLTASWLEHRSVEIREAVQKAGLQLGSLDIAHDGGQPNPPLASETEPDVEQDAPPAQRKTRCRAGGWTL